ncbi:MAG: PRD domain-containing protein, partial [Erysipelotrichaceae bacterium]|nr:PRD domain-containing protein [Erysipelotrichaceae bacterium]
MKNSRSPYLAVLDIDELSQILTAILVMALRIKEGFLITLSDPFIEELAEKPFYPEARYLLDHIQSRYKLDIPDKEARFLQVYMLSLNNEKNIEKESDLIAKELIGFWSSKLGDDLKDDKSLLNGITNYLSSALIRMKHGIAIDYPLMNDIDVLYPRTYQIVDLSSEILKKHLSCEITDEEKGVMTIYLAAAMERKKQPLQTALISTAGEGATQLLSAKIHRSFPEISLVKTFNYATLNSFKAEDYDIVLTTEKLKTKSEHIIQINPILYPEDLLRLKQIIKELDMKKNDPIKQGNVD